MIEAIIYARMLKRRTIFLLCYADVLSCVYDRLLDLLADRKDKTGRSGKVLINGQKRQANYKTMVAYVVQVNRLFSHLVFNKYK